jgi:hypothetical protein
MLESIKNDDIAFMECWYDSLCMTESFFTNYDNLALFDEGKLGHIRTGQIPLLSQEYLIDDDPKLSDKENFELKMGAGKCYVLAGRNFGKCEWEENFCLLANGEEIQFKDLINKTEQIISLNPITLKLEKAEAYFFDNGEKNCIELFTSKGKKITLTINHPLLTQKGWTEVQNIQIGDFIATPRKYDFEGYKIVDENIAKLLGYLLGDGSCTNQIGFTNINEELIKEFFELADYFDCKIRKSKITYYVSKKDNSHHNHTKSQIRELVFKYKINCKSIYKVIPKEVFLWKNKFIKILLNRYFACDGHINLSGKNHIIELCSMSSRMLYQVQSLLLRFGIQSSIGGNRLFITEDFDKFLNVIGIKSKDKGIRWNKTYTITDTVPTDFLKSITKNKKAFYYKSISIDKLKKKYGSNEKINLLVHSDIYWDKVKKISKVDKVKTVGVSVPLYNNYISNNIISHNTMCEKIDMLISLILLDGWPMGMTSYDAVHIRGVMEPVINCLEVHPIIKHFLAHKTKHPTYLITGVNNATIDGINMNITAQSPGSQFFQKHLKKLWVEEHCVAGHTKIRYIDDAGKINTNNISYLINSKIYKNIKLLSYNHLTEKIEFKKVTKIFKNQVKNYQTYKFFFDLPRGNKLTTLECSQGQKVFVNNKYVNPNEVKLGDNFFVLDHCDLSQTQKEVLIGCLLGDAGLYNRGNLSAINFVHGFKQKDYLNYKKHVLEGIFQVYRNTKNKDINNIRTTQVTNINDLKYNKIRHTLVCNSKETICLNEFKDFKYCKKDKRFCKINPELLYKYFTEKSLAFWYMDDGGLKAGLRKKTKTWGRYVTLHTQGYDYETNCLLRDFLKEKFNLIATIRGKKYYRLCFSVIESEKFLDLVEPYIYPLFNYKLKTRNKKFIDLTDIKYRLLPAKVLKIEQKKKSSWTMYDFEVADNHNFFGNGILISNSFETDEVYNKRVDSRHELGCIERTSGMCNFTKHSPAGRIFYDKSLKPYVLNLPQYINPIWNEKEKKKAAKKFGGEQSIGFRIYVKGEVVEEGLSVFDMARIRPFYKEGKVVKTFEILKQNFPFFKNLLIVERPNNAEQVYICADIGESAPSEIAIFFKVNNIYKFVYNITLQNLTDKEQFLVFQYLITQFGANVVSLDTSDGTGRAIFRSLEEICPKENLVWVAFNEKIKVDFLKDENDHIVYKDGNPEFVEEYVSEWSVKHLKDLLYDGKIEIPEDAYKLDTQLNSVRVFQSGTRLKYELTSEEDHLFQAFQVFAITQWMNEFNLMRPIITKVHCKTGI